MKELVKNLNPDSAEVSPINYKYVSKDTIPFPTG